MNQIEIYFNLFCDEHLTWLFKMMAKSRLKLMIISGWNVEI